MSSGGTLSCCWGKGIGGGGRIVQSWCPGAGDSRSVEWSAVPDSVAPEQIAVTGLKVGVIFGLTVMVNVAVVAH